MAAAVLWLLRLAGPERRGRAMGHIGLANYAGLTIGPPLSQALSGQAHPTRVWVTAAMLPLVAAACAAVLGRSPDRGVAPEPAADDGHEQPDAASSASTLRATLRPGLGLMLVNFGYVAVLSFGAAAATEQGTGIAALVIPVFGVGVIASRTILAGVPDRFGAPRTLIGRGHDRGGGPGRDGRDHEHAGRAARARRDGDRAGARGSVTRNARARVGAAEPARPHRRRVLRLLRRGRGARWSGRRPRGARGRPDRRAVRGGRRRARDRARRAARPRRASTPSARGVGSLEQGRARG